MTDSVVRIGLVYPELLGTYGDRGNALVLERRLAWRGIATEIVEVPAGELIPSTLDIYLFGGGEDSAQALAADGVRRSAHNIRQAHARGAVVFGVCAGFQILGSTYAPLDGRAMDGIGLLDATTVAGKARCVGECVVEPAGNMPLIIGFENHSGRTILGEGVAPLGTVQQGSGNGNGVDGALAKGLVATYLHGPVLARNPALADLVLTWVAGEMTALDDTLMVGLRAERFKATQQGRAAPSQ